MNRQWWGYLNSEVCANKIQSYIAKKCVKEKILMALVQNLWVDLQEWWMDDTDIMISIICPSSEEFKTLVCHSFIRLRFCQWAKVVPGTQYVSKSGVLHNKRCLHCHYPLHCLLGLHSLGKLATVVPKKKSADNGAQRSYQVRSVIIVLNFVVGKLERSHREWFQ